MSTFAVGEVAIYLCPNTHLHGTEVTITSALQYHRIYDWNIHGPVECSFYEFDSPLITTYERSMRPCARPEELLKRRPPQDWQILCKLDEAPSDCVAREGVVA